MTRISHADFPLPSSLMQAFGFQFSSVPLCVLCGENWVLTFSVSPCLRGGFWFLVVAPLAVPPWCVLLFARV